MSKFNLSTEQNDLVESLSKLVADAVDANINLELYRAYGYTFSVEEEARLRRAAQSAEEEVEDFFLRAIGAVEVCTKSSRIADHEHFETAGAGTKCWQCGTITV